MSYKETFVILFFCAMTAAVILAPRREYPATITLRGHTIKLEIADTAWERAQGLSDRPQLLANRGLLFVYPEAGYPSIWMKDMNFAIDILWLNDNWQIVHQERSVSPSTFPQTFKPKAPARYVLELRGGLLEDLN
jgi:uncharacterized protein